MDGQRVAKEEGGSKLPLIITGVVAAVLAAAYLGLCGWAAGRSAILPNVSVAGINVSNMTVEQAREAVETAVNQQGKDISLTLTYEGISQTLNGSDLTVDAEQSAQNAWAVGHGNFFTGGLQLLAHMLGASSQVDAVIPEGDAAFAEFLAEMERAVSANSDNSAYRIEDGQLTMTKGAPIATMNWEQVKADAQEELRQAFSKRFSGESSQVQASLTLAPQTQNDTQEPDFEAIHRELYTEPKDASLDLESMSITDHVVGVDFDVQALKSAWQAAKGGETFSIPVTMTQPKVTKDDLGGSLFADLLGEGTTTVSGSANRRHNVKLAASACNDKILLPGEIFSYNTCTGSRTAEAGYKMAPVYAGTRSEDGIGGGVCQPSSTIYFAVLHTNLEVVERYAHGFNTGYVEPGMDATVYFGVNDFRFKNTTDYPLKVVTNYYESNGKSYLNVKIYGTNPDGVYAVPRSDKYDRVAPTTVYSPDESVPRGTLVLDRQQYAYTGISAHTYRDVYSKDGKLIETQDMGTSRYLMRPNTYFYNPADGDPTTWVNGKPPVETTDPGTTDPGTTDPGTTTPEPPPADPGTTPEPEPQQPSDSGLNPIDPNAPED